jgi:hypothetical protein
MILLFRNLRLMGVAIGAVVAVLPLSSGACGNTACLVYSQAQYTANNGCPAASTALASFSSPDCPGAVTQVLGAGSYDGEYCCYPVTQQDSQNQGCSFGGDGLGGFGGSAGFGGAGGVACAAEGDACATEDECCASLICNQNNQCAVFGAGGGGAGGGCSSCNTELAALGSDASQLCGSAAPLWDSLISCSCNGGTCSAACAPTFCAGTSPDTGCTSCLDDTTTGCGQALAACMSD